MFSYSVMRFLWEAVKYIKWAPEEGSLLWRRLNISQNNALLFLCDTIQRKYSVSLDTVNKANTEVRQSCCVETCRKGNYF